LNPTLLAWLTFGLIAAFSGVLTALIIWGIKALVTKSKPRAMLLDEEGATSWFGHAKLTPRGELHIGKGENRRVYPVLAESRIMTNAGPIYVIGRQTGTNFGRPKGVSRAQALATPTKADIEATIPETLRAKWRVCSPFLLSRITAARTTEETLEGQERGEHPLKAAIVPAAIIVGLFIVVLGIVAGIAVGT
jgi:hypothetical protein